MHMTLLTPSTLNIYMKMDLSEFAKMTEIYLILVYISFTTYAANHVGRDFLFAVVDPGLSGYSQAGVELLMVTEDPANITAIVTADGVTYNVDVIAGDVATFALPTSVFLNQSVIDNKGIRVTSTGDISVYVRGYSNQSAYAFTVIPVDGLGTTYYAPAFLNSTANPAVEPVNNQTDHFVLLVANENATTITIHIPTGVKCLVNDAVTNGSSLQNLTLAQSMLVSCKQDLTGLKIEADKNVAVFAGTRVTESSQGAPQAMEQLLPTTAWGTAFYTARFSGDGGGFLRIVGKTAGTNITAKGELYSIGEGGSVDVGMTSGETFLVSSSEPVQVAQIIQATSISQDIAATILIPIDNTLINVLFAVPLQDAGGAVKMALSTSTANTAAVQLDGAAASSCAWQAVVGTSFSSSECGIGAGVHIISHSCEAIDCYVRSESSKGAYIYAAGFSLTAVSNSCPTVPSVTSTTQSSSKPATEVVTEVITGEEEDENSVATLLDGTTVPASSTTSKSVTPTDDSTEQTKDKVNPIYIVLGVGLGGIPLLLLTYIIFKAACCSDDKPKKVSDSKVEILKQPIPQSPQAQVRKLDSRQITTGGLGSTFGMLDAPPGGIVDDDVLKQRTPSVDPMTSRTTYIP